MVCRGKQHHKLINSQTHKILELERALEITLSRMRNLRYGEARYKIDHLSNIFHSLRFFVRFFVHPVSCSLDLLKLKIRIYFSLVKFSCFLDYFYPLSLQSLLLELLLGRCWNIWNYLMCLLTLFYSFYLFSLLCCFLREFLNFIFQLANFS